jgi:uncharacterized protein YdeI (BOF family)
MSVTSLPTTIATGLLLFATLTGTSFRHLEAAHGQPGLTPIRTVHKAHKDDDVVTVKGEVVRQLKKDEFIVRDDTGDILVDVERERHFGVSVGQTIVVRGTVDIGLFREKALKAIDVRIEDTSSTTTGDPTARADVKPIAEAYLESEDGDIVTVVGRIVRRLNQREFIIRDRSGEIVVDAHYGRFHNLPLNVAQGIVVTGEVDIYWGGPWREIEAHNIQMQEKMPESPLPASFAAVPIGDVRERAKAGDTVTIAGTIVRRVDSDDFLFQDDSGDIIVSADPRFFSHHGLRTGNAYTVTGRVDRGLGGRIEIVAMIVTALLPAKETAAPVVDSPPEIPISSVYYERTHGDIVTIAGSIVRVIDSKDLVLQDDTGSIVVDVDKDKSEVLDLSLGKFLIVRGTVKVNTSGGREIDARKVMVRKRPDEVP